MFNDNKKIALKGLILILLTILIYYVYYLIFGGVKDIVTSIILDIGTIPLNIVITAVIIDYVVDKREQKQKEKEINMLTGIFYNEIGTDLLDIFIKADECIDQIRENALIKKDWTEEKYEQLYKTLESYEYCVSFDKVDLDRLKDELIKNQGLLIDFLLNNLIEDKEEFTEVIMLVIHLRDELNDRFIGDSIDEYEKVHIKKDIDIAYKQLAQTWVDYMFHLSQLYPQLFTKALVTSPFDNRDKLVKDKEFLGVI